MHSVFLAKLIVGMLLCLVACQEDSPDVSRDTSEIKDATNARRAKVNRPDTGEEDDYGDEDYGHANAIGTKIAGGGTTSSSPNGGLDGSSSNSAVDPEAVEDDVESDPYETSATETAVVAFARSQMGQRVGNGQCTELAAGALYAAGASGRFPRFSDTGAYVWGEHVVQVTVGSSLQDLDKIRPGHILQLEGVSTNGMQAWHHTQVVMANLGNGVIAVAEQNPTVVIQQNWTYRSMRSGTVDVWAPSP